MSRNTKYNNVDMNAEYPIRSGSKTMSMDHILERHDHEFEQHGYENNE
jgi:hypothetical protein